MSTRHPGLLRGDDSILVVIDCQERLWKVIHEAQALEQRIGILVEGARDLGIPVVVTEQYPAGLGPTVPELLRRAGGGTAIVKDAFSCFGAPAFLEVLQRDDRSTLVLAGIETHICVLQTAFDALARGWRVHVVADAVGSRLPENRRIGLDRLAREGAVVTCLESVLFEWMERRDHPAFKKILDGLR